MKKTILIIFLLCIAFPCEAVTVNFARGPMEVKNGDTVTGWKSFFEGTIDGLENVTFEKINFSRGVPRTVVFTNCKNLTFIKCNLANVLVPKDSIVEDSLIVQSREYEQLGKTYRKVECKDGKTRTYEVKDEIVDVIDRDYKDLNTDEKEKLKSQYDKLGIEYTEETHEVLLILTEDTPNDKKISFTVR